MDFPVPGDPVEGGVGQRWRGDAVRLRLCASPFPGWCGLGGAPESCVFCAGLFFGFCQFGVLRGVFGIMPRAALLHHFPVYIEIALIDFAQVAAMAVYPQGFYAQRFS